ncbi:hypothetical protein D5R81_05180 [Parashewanella spongiae]|uniref:Uncharacterized protein n=1 Tax=Parashewanella spongiae TaxID=342950 RepID=A0A3A6TZL2_9GAMM|nr:hypothetical protein [Parashewanella spongiae]MCL1077951.1 hypothetical protein [Parashewanella spongiae]RJY18428.1 hypothetical protein D5R81_05180 [Parashewanella spongiae]
MASAVSETTPPLCNYAYAAKVDTRINSKSESTKLTEVVFNKISNWFFPDDLDKVKRQLYFLTNIQYLQQNRPDALMKQVEAFKELASMPLHHVKNRFKAEVENNDEAGILTFHFRIEGVTDSIEVTLPSIKSSNNSVNFFQITFNYSPILSKSAAIDIPPNILSTINYFSSLEYSSGASETWVEAWNTAVGCIKSLQTQNETVVEDQQLVGTLEPRSLKHDRLRTDSQLQTNLHGSQAEVEAFTFIILFNSKIQELKFNDIPFIQARLKTFLKSKFDNSICDKYVIPTPTSSKLPLSSEKVLRLHFDLSTTESLMESKTILDACVTFLLRFIPRDGDSYLLNKEIKHRWIADIKSKRDACANK